MTRRIPSPAEYRSFQRMVALESSRSHKAIDIEGDRFGRLVVVQYAGPLKDGHGTWKCRCDCGAEVTVIAKNLRNGNSKSCGCLGREKSALMMIKMHTRHGMSGLPEFSVWTGIKTRCMNPRSTVYKYYGARGIKLCQRWTDFANFYADMGPRPDQTFTVDRIDNDGDYAPGNCRWSTYEDQCNNRRTNRILEFEGERKTAAQWARLYGLKISTFLMRLKRGLSLSEALKTPLGKHVR